MRLYTMPEREEAYVLVEDIEEVVTFQSRGFGPVGESLGRREVGLGRLAPWHQGKRGQAVGFGLFVSSTGNLDGWDLIEGPITDPDRASQRAHEVAADLNETPPLTPIILELLLSGWFSSQDQLEQSWMEAARRRTGLMAFVTEHSRVLDIRWVPATPPNVLLRPPKCDAIIFIECDATEERFFEELLHSIECLPSD